MNTNVAALFPGQGAFYRAALKDARTGYAQVDNVMAEIDEVSKPWLKTSMAALFELTQPDIAELLADSPEFLQMAIYGISVATYKILQSNGLRPSVLMGHSFGEIAALTCSGVFTIGQGAEIVLHRTAALKALGKADGYMVALGTGQERAEKILELAGVSQSAVAGLNHNSQTVISGATAEMHVCVEIAKALKIPQVRLNSPYPFHSPVVKAACGDFSGRIQHIAGRKLQVPVFSPILNRYYTDGDAFAQCLSEHLVRPVNFAAAAERLYQENVRVYVECGALSTLCTLTSKALGKSDITTVACLDPVAGELKSLKAAIQTLSAVGALQESRQTHPGALLLPDISAAAFDTFWAARGGEVLAFAKRQFGEFEKTQGTERREAPALELAKPLPPAPSTSTARPASSRGTLFAELADMYAAALEYPQEVFTEDVELEGELGIDSVKQTELLARIGEQYELPPRSPDFRLGDYNTMGKIVDFVFATMANAPRSEGAIGPKVNGMAPLAQISGGLQDRAAYVN
jgi:acyl transferase domain-containing protein